ncbi:hypothetical protein OROGR_013494 [Orobanche gracilis]
MCAFAIPAYPLNDVVLIRRVVSAAYDVLKVNGLSDVTEGLMRLKAAVNAVIEYNGVIAGYRTLLNALIPASLDIKKRPSDGDEAFLQSSEAATEGADLTCYMQAREGDLVPEPGAMAAAAWYITAALAVKKPAQAHTDCWGFIIEMKLTNKTGFSERRETFSDRINSKVLSNYSIGYNSEI